MGIPLSIKSYQSLGNFSIDMPWAQYSNTTRILYLDPAITISTYTVTNTTFSHEAFVSPNNLSLPILKEQINALDTLSITNRRLRFESWEKVVTMGGVLKTVENKMHPTKADEIELIIVEATKYKSDNPALYCQKDLAALQKIAHTLNLI